MENFVTLLIPALLTVFFLRMVLQPIHLVLKTALHSGCGFACLWLLSCVSGFTGVYIPINAITVLIAGFLGLPGITNYNNARSLICKLDRDELLQELVRNYLGEK